MLFLEPVTPVGEGVKQLLTNGITYVDNMIRGPTSRASEGFLLVLQSLNYHLTPSSLSMCPAF